MEKPKQFKRRSIDFPADMDGQVGRAAKAENRSHRAQIVQLVAEALEARKVAADIEAATPA